MAPPPWLHLFMRRSSIKVPLSSHRIQCLFVRSSSSNSNEFIFGQSRVIGGTIICGSRGGGEEVLFSYDISLPFSLLNHSSTYHPHTHVCKGFRGFSHITCDGSRGCDGEIESECDNEEEEDDVGDEIGVNCVGSNTNPEEVERVCKVIDELFALD